MEVITNESSLDLSVDQDAGGYSGSIKKLLSLMGDGFKRALDLATAKEEQLATEIEQTNAGYDAISQRVIDPTEDRAKQELELSENTTLATMLSNHAASLNGQFGLTQSALSADMNSMTAEAAIIRGEIRATNKMYKT